MLLRGARPEVSVGCPRGAGMCPGRSRYLPAAKAAERCSLKRRSARWRRPRGGEAAVRAQAGRRARGRGAAHEADVDTGMCVGSGRRVRPRSARGPRPAGPSQRTESGQCAWTRASRTKWRRKNRRFLAYVARRSRAHPSTGALASGSTMRCAACALVLGLLRPAAGANVTVHEVRADPRRLQREPRVTPAAALPRSTLSTAPSRTFNGLARRRRCVRACARTAS